LAVMAVNTMDTNLLEKLGALAARAAEEEGCGLFDLELKPGKGTATLRVYIDKTGGVGVEDCANVSRRLGLALEVEDAFPGSYLLEVSSPGLTRPLKKPADFIRSVGKLAAVTVRKTASGGKGGKYLGVIEKADGETAHIRLKDGELISLAHGDIARANLEIEF